MLYDLCYALFLEFLQAEMDLLDPLSCLQLKPEALLSVQSS